MLDESDILVRYEKRKGLEHVNVSSIFFGRVPLLMGQENQGLYSMMIYRYMWGISTLSQTVILLA